MLGNKDAVANVAVKDLDVATKFYENTLGRTPVHEEGKEVAALKSKGVVFEHYDMPGMTRDGDVYISGDMKVAWFKDPDGNILNVAGR